MNYIVDDIEAVVNLMREDIILNSDVHYMYGHKVEIANRLTLKDKDKVFKYQKYPLVALKMDFAETWNDAWELNLNIAIITKTKVESFVPKRYEEVFKPILYPLYESFMRQLKNAGLFSWSGEQEYPPHTKIDRPFWGTPDDKSINERRVSGNDKHVFNDPLDAIEILNLQINRNKNC